MKLLDLFSGAGGAAMGYHHAGFGDITGIDILPQRHYPFDFWQGDAIDFALAHGHEFDAIHASPPCQAHSHMSSVWPDKQYVDLVAETRDVLLHVGKPFVIENVPGAPLHDPIMLCGTMFPWLKVIRHRLFELHPRFIKSVHAVCAHPSTRIPRAGRGPNEHGWISVAGHFSGVEAARKAMDISWMSRDELSQAIPPAYTHYIGHHLLKHLKGSS